MRFGMMTNGGRSIHQIENVLDCEFDGVGISGRLDDTRPYRELPTESNIAGREVRLSIQVTGNLLEYANNRRGRELTDLNEIIGDYRQRWSSGDVWVDIMPRANDPDRQNCLTRDNAMRWLRAYNTIQESLDAAAMFSVMPEIEDTFPLSQYPESYIESRAAGVTIWLMPGDVLYYPEHLLRRAYDRIREWGYPVAWLTEVSASDTFRKRHLWLDRLYEMLAGDEYRIDYVWFQDAPGAFDVTEPAYAEAISRIVREL